jgi:hypothetical protein
VARGSETHLVLRGYPIAGHAAGRCVRAMKSHSPLGRQSKGLWLFMARTIVRPDSSGGKRSYTSTNSSSSAPQMGHEAGGWPNSMCPQVGQRKNLTSARSFPCFTASSAIWYSLACTASARTA